MDANLLLTWLTPLFKDIEDGKVISSCYYEYRVALGKDSPFYEPSSPFFSAESAFVCALEDWVSQAWYQEGKRRADEKEK
ncbi:hypothetical protein GCM10007863_30730 [Dyella mobilis]|nr:hypothetical protein GCM10007863_30730 [Dyella mobilis]